MEILEMKNTNNKIKNAMESINSKIGQTEESINLKTDYLKIYRGEKKKNKGKRKKLTGYMEHDQESKL